MSTPSSHSPEFIAEMKEKLLAEQTQLTKELKAIANKDGSDFQAAYPEYGRHEEENVDEIADYAARAGSVEAAEERLKNVTKALEAIADGSYGTTAEGEVIPEARLRANPAATTLVTKE